MTEAKQDKGQDGNEDYDEMTSSANELICTDVIELAESETEEANSQVLKYIYLNPHGEAGDDGDSDGNEPVSSHVSARDHDVLQELCLNTSEEVVIGYDSNVTRKIHEAPVEGSALVWQHVNEVIEEMIESYASTVTDREMLDQRQFRCQDAARVHHKPLPFQYAGQNFNEQSQKLILNAIHFLKLHRNDDYLEKSKSPLERTARLLNIHSSVIKKLEKNWECGIIEHPGKKRKMKKRVLDSISTPDENTIRWIIRDMHAGGQTPFIPSILTRVREHLNFTGSRTSFRRILKRMGYAYRRVNKKFMLIDCNSKSELPLVPPSSTTSTFKAESDLAGRKNKRRKIRARMQPGDPVNDQDPVRIPEGENPTEVKYHQPVIEMPPLIPVQQSPSTSILLGNTFFTEHDTILPGEYVFELDGNNIRVRLIDIERSLPALGGKHVALNLPMTAGTALWHAGHSYKLISCFVDSSLSEEKLKLNRGSSLTSVSSSGSSDVELESLCEQEVMAGISDYKNFGSQRPPSGSGEDYPHFPAYLGPPASYSDRATGDGFSGSSTVQSNVTPYYDRRAPTTTPGRTVFTPTSYPPDTLGFNRDGQSSRDSSPDEPSVWMFADKSAAALSIFTENFLSHPFLVLRRQCQVHVDSRSYHISPFSLITPVFHICQRQGFGVLWKGLGSSLLVRGMTMFVEDLTSKVSSLPNEVTRHSSMKSVCQHILLKAISLAVITPFYSINIMETAQSDVASESAGLLDVFTEGFMRIFTWPNTGRLVPLYVLIVPTVIHGLLSYLIYTGIKSVSLATIRRVRESKERKGGALSKDSGVPFYAEMTAGLIGHATADILLYPLETVLHRLHLQGTRTIIDSLDCGIEVTPVITGYEGVLNCFRSIVEDEGVRGLYKGFGALILQYGIQVLLIRGVKIVMEKNPFGGNQPKPTETGRGQQPLNSTPIPPGSESTQGTTSVRNIQTSAEVQRRPPSRRETSSADLPFEPFRSRAVRTFNEM